MSVAVILRMVELVRSKGVVVTFEPGWDTRGNGQTSQYEGLIEHHTAIAASYSNPMPGLRVVRDGRSDLRGPLANFLGPYDGSLRVIAAHPANHAGASGGRSMGPLPVTRLFNPRVLGVEFDYAGNSPMSPEQYRTAQVLAWATGQMWGTVERCRAHMETSVEGKWDPGYAPGRTINMGALRTEAASLRDAGGFLMALSDQQQKEIYNVIAKVYTERGVDMGDVLVEFYDFIKAFENAMGGKEGGQGLGELYAVIAQNYARQGEGLGDTTADIENKVDVLTSKLDAVLAKLSEA